MSSRSPRSRPSASDRSDKRAASDAVGARSDKSINRPARTKAGTGPRPKSTRPKNTPSRQSAGKSSISWVISSPPPFQGSHLGSAIIRAPVSYVNGRARAIAFNLWMSRPWKTTAAGLQVPTLSPALSHHSHRDLQHLLRPATPDQPPYPSALPRRGEGRLGGGGRLIRLGSGKPNDSG